MIEGDFSSKVGRLYCRRWDAQGELRAVLMIVHGLGEHCARYEKLADYFSERGIAVCAFDLPGHGRSPGVRGHQNCFEDYIDAALTFRSEVGQWYPGQPVFLLGHSMGGLISTVVLTRKQSCFLGAVLSGPAIISAIEVGGFQQFLIRLLSKVAPKLGALALDPAGVSRDPAVVEDYQQDPLVHHGKVSARLVAELFHTMEQVRHQVSIIELPMLLLHGGADNMTAASGSQFLYDNIRSTDKTLKIYDGLYHEVLKEPEAPDIFVTFYNWLDKHLVAE